MAMVKKYSKRSHRPTGPIRVPGFEVVNQIGRVPAYIWPLGAAAVLGVLRLSVDLSEPRLEESWRGELIRAGAQFELRSQDYAGLRRADEQLGHADISASLGEPVGRVMGITTRVRDRVTIRVTADISGETSPEARAFLSDESRVAMSIADVVRARLRSAVAGDLVMTPGLVGGERERITLRPWFGVLWVVVLVGLVAWGVVLLVRGSPESRRARRIAAFRCPKCRYSLEPLRKGCCYRCGEPITPQEQARLQAAGARIGVMDQDEPTPLISSD
jgi:hypothetical protein